MGLVAQLSGRVLVLNSGFNPQYWGVRVGGRLWGEKAYEITEGCRDLCLFGVWFL